MVSGGLGFTHVLAATNICKCVAAGAGMARIQETHQFFSPLGRDCLERVTELCLMLSVPERNIDSESIRLPCRACGRDGQDTCGGGPMLVPLVLASALAQLVHGVNSVPQLGVNWLHVGPFPVGKTEIDGDPLYAEGGAGGAGGVRALIEKGDFSGRFTSELATGGTVGWTTLRGVVSPGQQQSSLSLQYPMPGAKETVDFNSFVQSTQRLSTLEFQAWVVNKVSWYNVVNSWHENTSVSETGHRERPG